MPSRNERIRPKPSRIFYKVFISAAKEHDTPPPTTHCTLSGSWPEAVETPPCRTKGCIILFAFVSKRSKSDNPPFHPQNDLIG